MIYPEPEKGGRGQKLFRPETVSHSRVSLARTVLRHDLGKEFAGLRISCELVATSLVGRPVFWFFSTRPAASAGIIDRKFLRSTAVD
jgi:hypothetical protein